MTCLSCLCLDDRSHLKVARCLRQDTAVEVGACHEQNVRLDQEDSLQLRTCAHSYITGDLPEDILRLYAAQEFHFGVRGLHKALLCLHDEDVVFVALEGDIRAEHDIHVKGVDARRQSLATDVASSDIGPVTAFVEACLICYIRNRYPLAPGLLQSIPVWNLDCFQYDGIFSVPSR